MKGPLASALRRLPVKVSAEGAGCFTWTCLQPGCSGVMRAQAHDVTCATCGYDSGDAVTTALVLAALRWPARRAEIALRDVVRAVGNLPVPSLLLYRDARALHADALGTLQLEVEMPE